MKNNPHTPQMDAYKMDKYFEIIQANNCKPTSFYRFAWTNILTQIRICSQHSPKSRFYLQILCIFVYFRKKRRSFFRYFLKVHKSLINCINSNIFAKSANIFNYLRSYLHVSHNFCIYSLYLIKLAIDKNP